MMYFSLKSKIDFSLLPYDVLFFNKQNRFFTLASVLVSKELVSLLPAFQLLVKNFFSPNTRNTTIHLIIAII